MAQRFYNLVLLPRVRDDLAEYKRLNFHLYQALRKALFKPGAFMKGILLPLLEVSLRAPVFYQNIVIIFNDSACNIPLLAIGLILHAGNGLEVNYFNTLLHCRLADIKRT